jgi:hypothetical protein
MNQESYSSTFQKIVALWAFTEAFLGGILHIAKIPFTGLIIGNFALLYISLLVFFVNKRGQIIKASVVVILIKMIISPYTPVLAYFAVFYQAIFGELFYFSGKYKPYACLILGILFAILSSLQKIISLTILYGMTLWESIDSLINYILIELSFQHLAGIKYSFYIVGIYFLIHLVAGIVSSILIIRFIRNLSLNLKNQDYYIDINFDGKNNVSDIFKKKKRKIINITQVIFYIFLILILILSYISPDKFNLPHNAVLLMILRGILVFIIWFKIISPVLLKALKKLYKKENSKYTRDLEFALGIQPLLKYIVLEAWHKSSKQKGIKKLRFLMKIIIFNLLSYTPSKTEYTVNSKIR